MNILIKNNRGFTLIEMVVVMLIIGIISAVVISRLMDTSVELIAQTDVIKTHLRYAQSMAMSDNSVWGIFCDGNRYYWLYNNGNIANMVGLPGEDKDSEDKYRIDFTVSADQDPRWQHVDTIEAFTLSFDDRGIPHTDASATVKLTSDHDYSQITVSSGGKSKRITIAPNTGFIP